MKEDQAAPPASPGSKSHDEHYQKFSETVGCVPWVRKKDNLAQGVAVLVGVLLGAVSGFFFMGVKGAIRGAIGGLLVTFLLSGLVLMVVGWVRNSK